MVLSSPPGKSFGFGQAVSKSLRQTTLVDAWIIQECLALKSERCFSIMGILWGDALDQNLSNT
jgi:hypothetical protein